MEIYLVGGAVRDQLLGIPVKERDWVVVGATPEELRAQGFTQVGRDFPVFLHPVTHEEYALARTERKVTKGYTGFVCHAHPGVTLLEDLKRRDLTINAMAQDCHGQLIDPYGGYYDLTHQILRHVSEAFAEDPVRILRVARFAARLAQFTVHPTTNQLMQQILASGEVAALVPERVWQELKRALGEPAPWRFFGVLNDCQTLAQLFPGIAARFPASLQALKQATSLSPEPMIRFATLLASATPAELAATSAQYRIPTDYQELALLTINYGTQLAQLSTASDRWITLLEQSDAYRRPARFHQFLLACQASGFSDPKMNALLTTAQQVTKHIKLTQAELATPDKTKLKALLHLARQQALQDAKLGLL